MGHGDNPPEELFKASRQVELPQGDLMEALLRAQAGFLHSLEERYPERWGPPQVHLREQVLMLFAEAKELLDCTAWKKHKSDYGRPLTPDERDAAIEEAVDLLHFVFNCFILLGVTSASEVYRYYMAKHTVNRKRQADGY